MRLIPFVLAVAASALVSVGVGGPASAAPCAATAAYNGSLFNYERCQIPDVDQRRAEEPPFTPGLPNDGSMYCVPTSALDLLAYLADQGFPSIAPGPGYWGPEFGFPPQGQYNTMTAAIDLMGTLMVTDPNDGTGGDTALFGIAVWLAGSGVGSQFTVSHYAASGFYAPLFTTMALAAVDGALIMPAVGWYKKYADLPPEIKDVYASLGIPLPQGFYRDGGHVMALAKAVGSVTGDQVIGVRNPAAPNDGMLFDQSPFSTDPYEVVNKTSYFGGAFRMQSKVVGLGTNAFLDEYFAIKPKYAVLTDALHIVFLRPIKPKGDDSPEVRDLVSFPSATGGRIADIAIHPELTRHPYLIEGENTIWQIDALTGRSTPFATVGNPKRIVFGGPEQTVYVLLPNHLIALDQDGRQTARTLLDEPLDAIAYDERRAELVGISSDRDSVEVFDAALTHVDTIDLPELPCSGKITLQFDPATGDFIVHCDGSARLLKLAFGDRRSAGIRVLELQGAESPVGLAVDDAGHLFLSDGGMLAEFDANGRRVEESPFAGLPGGDSVEISRSFSNFDPATMSDARFRNVLPEDAG